MPKVDIYHEVVKQALIKDGWTITHDPFPLPIGHKRLYVDLGADRLISADKGTYSKIKQFSCSSLILKVRSLRNGSHFGQTKTREKYFN